MESSHFDAEGRARMIDVGTKAETQRRAVATGLVRMQPTTQACIESGQIGKGDVLAVARLAGIQGAKLTAQLIPLCHPLRLDGVELEFEFLETGLLLIRAQVLATDRTGVEMEALTAVAVAALTVYDMCKSIDRGMELASVRLEEKSGGKSGQWLRRDDLASDETDGSPRA
jgi:cyclic pyranopterin phosphate synthase